MSKLSIREVDCPFCGSKQEIAIWDSINVSIEAGIKEKFLSGEIFKFTCKACGSVFPVAYPILYHDMENKIMIWLLNEGEEMEGINDSIPKADEGRATENLEGYKYRIVSDINELIDKIRIFDGPMDDKVVEVLKRLMTLAIKSEVPEQDILGISYENSDKGEPCLMYMFENSRAARLSIDEATVAKIQKDYGRKMEMGTGTGFLKINQAWAEEIMRKN